MSRKLRIEFEGAFYHVTSRGHQKRRIFTNDHDRKRFLTYLHEYLVKFNVTLYSYIFMRNHYHLLIQTKCANLSLFMHSLNSAYSSYYNKKRKRIGALFQGRYDAELVESEDYFLEATRYIHLNPVRVFIVKDPKNYFWSSYGSYIGTKDDAYISMSWITKYLGDESALEYERFVLSRLDAKNPFKKTKHFTVLGSDQFLEHLEKYIETIEAKAYKESCHYDEILQQNAENIIAFVCRQFNVEKKAIFRAKRGNFQQKMTIYLLKRFTGLSTKQIANMFSHSCAAVRKVCSRVEKDQKHRQMLNLFLHNFEQYHSEM